MEILEAEDRIHAVTVGTEIHIARIAQEAVANVPFPVSAGTRSRTDVAPLVRVVTGRTGNYPRAGFVSLFVEYGAVSLLALGGLAATHADATDFDRVGNMGRKFVTGKFALVMAAAAELFLGVFPRTQFSRPEPKPVGGVVHHVALAADAGFVHGVAHSVGLVWSGHVEVVIGSLDEALVGVALDAEIFSWSSRDS